MTSKPSLPDLFDNGDTFDVTVDHYALPEDELRFDILDPVDMWVWLPRLGPTATLMYTNVLRYWPHRDLSTDTIPMNVLELGTDIGVAGAIARSAWARLHMFRVMSTGPVTMVSRWLPAPPSSALDRMTPAWNAWYRELSTFRKSQQGLT